jgi:hypothetical protein
MAITPDDLHYANTLPAMSDHEFLQAWHAAIAAGNDQRIGLIESAATHRFGMSGWMERYAAQFPDQTHYQFPPKPAA